MASDEKTGILKGKRILILEENSNVADLLTGMVTGFGCEVLGPANQLSDALDLISGVGVDAAILDVTIKGEISFVLADELARKGTPYAFASGNKTSQSIERYAPRRIITKPYAEQHIFQVLCDLIAGPADDGCPGGAEEL